MLQFFLNFFKVQGLEIGMILPTTIPETYEFFNYLIISGNSFCTYLFFESGSGKKLRYSEPPRNIGWT